MPELPKVAGYCPMGCGETLFLGDGGHVTCSLLACPNPTVVDAVLTDPETEHVVRIGDNTFTIMHPLRERVKGELYDCPLHTFMAAQSDSPLRPGRYRASASGSEPSTASSLARVNS